MHTKGKPFVTMIWVGLVMNKWMCFGGEAPHAQIDGSSPSPGTLSIEGWCNMSDHHGYQRWILACSVFPSFSVLLCRLRLQPQLKFLMEEVWKPSKVKRRRGDQKQSEREEGRSVGRKETCSIKWSSLSFWCIQNMRYICVCVHRQLLLAQSLE